MDAAIKFFDGLWRGRADVGGSGAGDTLTDDSARKVSGVRGDGSWPPLIDVNGESRLVDV